MSSGHLPNRRERIASMIIFRAFRGLGPRSTFRIKDSTKLQRIKTSNLPRYPSRIPQPGQAALDELAKHERNLFGVVQLSRRTPTTVMQNRLGRRLPRKGHWPAVPGVARRLAKHHRIAYA